MAKRILFIIIGTALMFLGAVIFVKGGFYLPVEERYIDFTEIRVFVSILLGLTGLLFLHTALRSKAKTYDERFLMCPTCRTSFNSADLSDELCPKCKVMLEDLHGFYDRHPEQNPETE